MSETSAAVPRRMEMCHVCGGKTVVEYAYAPPWWCRACNRTGRVTVPVRPRRNWWRVLWRVMRIAPWVAAYTPHAAILPVGLVFGVLPAAVLVFIAVFVDLLLCLVRSVDGKLSPLFTACASAIAYVRRRAEEE
jgi:hypothetical protein